jgi:hypothetical protein
VIPISGIPEISGYITPKPAIADLGAADRIPLSLITREGKTIADAREDDEAFDIVVAVGTPAEHA